MSMSQDYPDPFRMFVNFSSALWERYSRTGILKDLDEAIRTSRLAIASIPTCTSDHGLACINLSNQLSSRYEHTNSLCDLEEAMKFVRIAVNSLPEHHF